LQDSLGNPEKTVTPASVRLSVRNASVGSVPTLVTIQPGSTFSQIVLNSSLLAGSTNITAVASGFKSAETGFTSFLLPMDVRSLLTNPFLMPGQRVNFTLIAESQGIPVAGALVNWSSTSGTFLSVQNFTDVNGSATALYAAGARPGAILLDANVSKPGYTWFYLQSSLRINNVSNTASQTGNNILTMKVSIIPVWALIVVAVAAPAAAFFVIRRRASAGSNDIAADEEE